MTESNIENLEAKEINTIEDAVRALDNGNRPAVIEFLKNNKDDIGEFCHQVFDGFQKADKKVIDQIDPSGIYQLSSLIKDLLEN